MRLTSSEQTLSAHAQSGLRGIFKLYLNDMQIVVKQMQARRLTVRETPMSGLVSIIHSVIDASDSPAEDWKIHSGIS